MNRLASLDGAPSGDWLRTAGGQELLTATVLHEPQPSGRRIVDNAAIRGVNYQNVTRLVDEVKAAAPALFP
jgi:hypothetical protein